MTYDLAVVGAGPAGTSAALTAAARGLSVVLCERGSYDRAGGRDRVCGEFISPEALPLLSGWVPALAGQAPLITSVRLNARNGPCTTFALPQPACGISRLALDAALWNAAAGAGVTLRARTAIAEVSPSTGGYVLRAAGSDPVASRNVIWAAGRQTARARRRWLGVKARLQGLPLRAQVELYALRGGYCGVAPVENGWTNVCCLLRADRAPTLAATDMLTAWLARIRGSEALCQRLHGAQQATPTVVTAGITLGAREAVREGILQAGDASGFVDPFTGDGIARALHSGHLAAIAVAERRTGEYPRWLATAARPGFRTGAALRAAFSAPAWAQTLALRVLAHPALGPRLVMATRWGRL